MKYIKCICGYTYNPEAEDAKYKMPDAQFIELVGNFKIRHGEITYTNLNEIKLYVCPWCGTVRYETEG